MLRNEDNEGALSAPSRSQHIRKRALKNKALSVSFNEKDLRDYVTGFHKRKKKRRREAEKQQEEAKRRKRIEARKKRKAERDQVYGVVPPADGSVDEQNDDNADEEEMSNPRVSGTTTYESGNVTVTVTTSEVPLEEELYHTKKVETITTTQLFTQDKRHNLPIAKAKPFNKAGKHRSKMKPRSKRDKKKGMKRK